MNFIIGKAKNKHFSMDYMFPTPKELTVFPAVREVDTE